MMKFLPVAALTASVICVISASLKFGVMRPACWAEARDTTAMRTGAQRNKTRATPPGLAGRVWLATVDDRKQFTRRSPRDRTCRCYCELSGGFAESVGGGGTGGCA